MINILVIGSGAREAALVYKLRKDGQTKIKIVCLGTNKNPTIDNICRLYVFNRITCGIVESFIAINKIHFAIIGPENPLKDGISDLLEENGIPCIGPLSLYAQIETSKIFARQFLNNHGLGEYSPKYLVYNGNNFDKIKKLSDKLVVKYDGLHGGKGVKVQDIDFDSIYDLKSDFEKSKEAILCEEKLVGEEFSLMAITDGVGNIRHFPPIQDYKRLNDNDLGPNTGSMGCLIDKDNTLPFLNPRDIEICENINTCVINNLSAMGKTKGLSIGYRGILYGSFIKTAEGKIYIIEFNARFGDPEGIMLINMLETNFCALCLEVFSNNLTLNLKFSKMAYLGIYMVPKNYPGVTKDKYDIYIDDKINYQNIVFGNVEESGNHIYSLSSRSLFYFEMGNNLLECRDRLYSSIKGISGNLYYRTDIGRKFLNSYESVGVSIHNGNQAIKMIKKNIQNTYNDNVLGKYGDFGGQYKFGDQVLVASIDGVGTKSVMAYRHRGLKSFVGLGKDIVNHSVNDILVQGARPLFFLDYFGTDKLRLDEINYFIQGASEACIENGKFPILGGETAEMPLVYSKEKTDLVGCIIGVKDNRFFENPVLKGNILLAIPSDGPHTNGFSLINSLKDIDTSVVDTLLRPHKSYLNVVDSFVEEFGYSCLTSMAHITGGGLIENIKRVVPNNLDIFIDFNQIEMPHWCEYIMAAGSVSRDEMLTVFNCGVGYVLIVDNSKIDESKKSCLNRFLKIGYIY